MNTFGVHLLHYLNNISIWWHALGTTSLVIAVLAKAPRHQPARFVFRQFLDGTGLDGVGWGDRASHGYIIIIGVSDLSDHERRLHVHCDRFSWLRSGYAPRPYLSNQNNL